jgi:hypothetical protein
MRDQVQQLCDFGLEGKGFLVHGESIYGKKEGRTRRHWILCKPEVRAIVGNFKGRGL